MKPCFMDPDLHAVLNRLIAHDKEIAELRARVETLEQLVADLCKKRSGVVGIAGGQPRPSQRGNI